MNMQDNRLHRIGADRSAVRKHISCIIQSYDSIIIRAYCRVRFIIMRIRLLEELNQYIPQTGRVLDLGCGFGLFSLFFAGSASSRKLLGVDLNNKRITMAQCSAKRLGLTNVEYAVSNASDAELPPELSCIYMLDLLHHLPENDVAPLLRRIHRALNENGMLLIKDVDTRPFYKRWFTLLLDRIMVGMEPIRYWSAEEMIGMLESAGFQVYSHEMRDILPYPHRLYICRKR